MESRARLHQESKKTAIRQEAIPDMEDSPPVSDSDVSLCVRVIVALSQWFVLRVLAHAGLGGSDPRRVPSFPLRSRRQCVLFPRKVLHPLWTSSAAC